MSLVTTPATPTAEFCVFCGYSLGDNSNFCTSCGKPRRLAPPDPREGPPQDCNSCGNVESAHNRYCSRCGKPLQVTDRGLPIAEAPKEEPTSLSQDVGEMSTLQSPFGADPTDAMGSVTTILSTGDRGPTFPLALAHRTTVGRSGTDMAFKQDRYLSPTHCEIQGTDAGVMIRDLGSVNGTFLRLKQPASVGEGGCVILGHQVLRVRSVRPAAPQVGGDGTVLRGSAARATGWALEQLDASGAVRDVFHLPPTGCSIGRQVGDLRFPMDTFVSTEHVKLTPEADRLTVTDLNSSNGTWLRLGSPYLLRDGDQVLAGFTILHFHLPKT